MGMLKKIIFTILTILVIFIAIGYFLPSDYQVQRSVTVNAPAEKVYAQVADLKKWRDWGVWYEKDPNMIVSYSGPESGVGMKSSWKSSTEGDGEMTIVAVEPAKSVTYDLYFPDFEMSSTGQLTFAQNGGQTVVTWVAAGDVGGNPVNRYFAMAMDSLIGPDFEKGLANLKSLSEK
ncbi:SRPBCC family protein [Aliiglaciecola lipolytica]|uniref:Polyketide cyclase/dehydrase n=1 Tax=Aliiglaciecola lipolytica E3 TaxID=1127673 RepID=K6Y7L0_9ALTE|nr:SRPBCC family protein [Aliiglaciecola lipolytica]GAC14202.1 hypothetical protein GLIP_1568 [Aliiglaciecola lipolytica E3]